MTPFVVSACLAGVYCRYDGSHALCAPVLKLVEQGKALAICPEILGDLPTPRSPVELQGQYVRDANGHDHTMAFVEGAKRALELSLEAGCSMAILKTRSPSCGRDKIYDGTFSHTLVNGQGLWAKMLKEHNIKIYTEEDLPEDIEKE